MDVCFDLAQEAAYLSDCYANVHKLISNPTVKDYVPYSWLALIQVKREFYSAMAHFHVAKGLLDKEEITSTTRQVLEFLHTESAATQLDIKIPKNDVERRLLGMLNVIDTIEFIYNYLYPLLLIVISTVGPNIYNIM